MSDPHPSKSDDDRADHQEDDYTEGCNRCGGERWIIVCVDDICRGAGECMHGDGAIPCPDCDYF